jgi:hypothetical protein
MLQKSKVLETVEDLPDRFSMDELFEKMYVTEKIEKGLEQVRNGETVSEEDLDEEIESWFK